MLLWLAILLVPLQDPVPVKDAAKKKPVVLNADFVWGRQYRQDALNPIVVTVENTGPDIEGLLLARWGDPELYQRDKNPTPATLQNPSGPLYELPVVIPKNTVRRYLMFVRGPGWEQQSPWIFLVSGRTCHASYAVGGIAFRRGQHVVGVVGAQPGGLTGANAQVGLARPEFLPDRWHGYAPLTALVWTDADAGVVRDPGQIDALKQWIALGGHFVVARCTTAGLAGTFLEELLPVTFKGATSVSDWDALGVYAKVASPPSLEGAVLIAEPRTGSAVATAGKLPLVHGTSYGRGRITLLTFDPNGAALEKWEHTDAFWKTLIGPPPAIPPERPNDFTNANARALGSNKLHNMLKVHPGIPMPSLGWAFLLICLYALLVGPVDYVALKLLKRMELTWLTFPVCVGVFSGIALLAAASAGTIPPLVRETQVIDCVPDGGMSRGWSVVSVLTPQERKLTLGSAKPEAYLDAFPREDSSENVPPILREGLVREWYAPRGATSISVGGWAENACPVGFAPDGPNRLKIRNDLPNVIRGAYYFRRGQAWSVGDVPPGSSTVELRNRLGKWQAATGQIGAADRGSDYGDNEYGYRHSRPDEGQLRADLRGHLGALSFAGALSNSGSLGTGLAPQLDVSGWVREGDELLFGWTEAPAVLRFEGIASQRTADLLVRVFRRHE